MTESIVTIRVNRAFGPVVEGEAAVSREGFSPRYDLDRAAGIVSRPGHDLEGLRLRDKILIVPTARGGVAAGWAFSHLKHEGIGPKALVFGVVNPVMVQGAIFAGLTITEGWSIDPARVLSSGDTVRVDPARGVIDLIRRKSDPPSEARRDRQFVMVPSEKRGWR
jgi:uncharacterized protein